MSVLVLVVLGAVALGAVGWWAFENARRRAHPVPEGLQPEIALPHEREFELYHNALSLCSMKARLCLSELGIRYASTSLSCVRAHPRATPWTSSAP